jgi:hypothetical protein
MARAPVVIATVVLALGCGRINYDPLGDGGSNDVPGSVVDAPGVDASVLPRDPLAHYPCDADPAATSSVLDVSGNAHHGVCAAVDCPALATGIIGGACDFTDDIARIADHPGFRSPTGLSVALWVNARTVGGYHVTFGRPVGSEYGNAWSLEIQPGGGSCAENAFVFVTDSPVTFGELVCTPFSVMMGRWYHVVATWDGTNKALYVDGALIGSLPHPIEFDAHDVTLGADINFDTEEGGHFEGQLDEIYFFERALTAVEVRALYDARVGG